jgi:acetyl-CoA carboxylase carboxyl transferase subunit alpha
MGITAHRLNTLGLVDEVITEPLGGAHRDRALTAERVSEALNRHLAEVEAQPLEAMVAERYERLMRLGHYRE